MKTILSGACFILLGSTAFADSLSNKSASPYSWDGLYVGAQIGYGSGSSPAPYGFAPGGPYDFFQEGPDQKGFVGGGFVGYNRQINQLVIGAEADLQYSDIGGDDHMSGGDVNGLFGNWQASARVKVGYAFDRFLPYVTGGLALLNANATAPYGAPNDSMNFTGVTVGVGLEYAFTDNLITKIEYRYTEYGAKEASFPDLGYYEEYKPKHRTIYIGLSYKF